MKQVANTIFSKHYGLVHNNFDILYKEKLSIFTDYLRISKEEAL